MASSALFASSWLATTSVKQQSTPSGGPACSVSSRSTVARSLSIAVAPPLLGAPLAAEAEVCDLVDAVRDAALRACRWARRPRGWSTQPSLSAPGFALPRGASVAQG
eukprot:9467570-Pyramimonas_sp.AAC.1